MPIPQGAKKPQIIKEVMDKYNQTGTIGNIHPKNKKKAMEMGAVIAHSKGKKK